MAVRQEPEREKTLGELLTLFQSYLVSRKRKPDTLAGYKAHLGQFIKFAGHGTPISKIDTTRIDLYRAYLVERKLSDYTINSYLRAVGLMLGYAHRRGLLVQMPLIEYVEVEARGPKPGVSQDEFNRLLAAAEDEHGEVLQLRARAILLMFWISGIRVSELARATIGQIKAVNVDGQEAYILMVSSAKNRPPRPAVISREVWEAVKAYRERAGVIQDALFLSDEGEVITRRGIQHLIYRLAGRAAVKVSPHAFRRNFAHTWLNKSQGRELDTLKTVGGWASDEIIKTHYAEYEYDTLVRVYRRNAPKWDDRD
jgi:site-specific recombinase XerD